MLAACRDCGARHHEGCWDEAGRCGACGCGRALRDTTPPPPERPAERRRPSGLGPAAAAAPAAASGGSFPWQVAGGPLARPASGRHRSSSGRQLVLPSFEELEPHPARTHARKAVVVGLLTIVVGVVLFPFLGSAVRLLARGDVILGLLLLFASTPATLGLLALTRSTLRHVLAARRLSQAPRLPGESRT